jgi:acetyl esterase/lipase
VGVALGAVVSAAMLGLVAAPAAAGGPGSVPTPSGVVTVDRNLPYAGDGADGRTLDVYRLEQPTDAPRPAIVMVHGGGWLGGGADDMARQATLAARQGWVVFNINYRGTSTLGKEGQAWPTELRDVQDAMTWAHGNAGDHGADPDRMAMLGASAGGNLTALATAEGPEWVKAVALWSAPTELVPLVAGPDGTVPACDGNDECQEFWSYPWVTEFLGCAPADCAQTYTEASPIDQVGGPTPPTFIVNSTDELVPLEQAQKLASRLAGAGVRHELHVVDGDGHAYAYTATVWNEMMPFLADRVGVPAPEPIDFETGADLTTPVVVIAAVAAILLIAVLVTRVGRRRETPGASG